MTPDLDHRPRLSQMTRVVDNSPPAVETVEAADTVEAVPKRTPTGHFAGRRGFDKTFIPGLIVDLPRPLPGRDADVLPVANDPSGRLDYMHFSVVMSRSRRMAMFVGVNIAGADTVRITRTRDVWALDGRVPDEAQLGEDLYAGNRLDRGHLVRREDPNWSQAEADLANADTFHFTNCAPQMDVVNQRTWLGLETYILKGARVAEERISVFTGPIFGSNDSPYRGALIPKAFWKVVAFISDDGKPSASAYIVEQDEELSELEAAFGAYKTYQKSVRHIETLTGLSFGPLRQYDGFSNEEAAESIRLSAVIRKPGDIRV